MTKASKLLKMLDESTGYNDWPWSSTPAKVVDYRIMDHPAVRLFSVDLENPEWEMT